VTFTLTRKDYEPITNLMIGVPVLTVHVLALHMTAAWILPLGSIIALTPNGGVDAVVEDL
jgi:hypothetical protein